MQSVAWQTKKKMRVNFPVASVLVHSIHKPYGKGNLTSSEFWNLAGRAGRVGLVEKGLVIFANPEHRSHAEAYAGTLSASIFSALLVFLNKAQLGTSLKDLYQKNPEVRPFIQYLAHAAATLSPSRAIDDIEELLQASLANLQVNPAGARRLRAVARSYLQEISSKQVGYLKAADQTGLGSFSFDQLFASIRSKPILEAGPAEVLRTGELGFFSLVEVLRWLPELGLAIGMGKGSMNVQAVAHVLKGWIDGNSVADLSGQFPGADLETRLREAGRYIYGKVTQTLSWGAHAYLK